MKSILSTVAALIVCSVSPHSFAVPSEEGLYVEFNTSLGTFTAELFYEKAPLSCANMVGLIEGSVPYYDAGSDVPQTGNFFDGLIFHRVIENFVLQGGDPTGTGAGGPGYSWPDEVRSDLLHDAAGILSMANAGPNTNGSQFFVTLAATPHLNGLHNVFGEVVEGMDVVRSIGSTPVANTVPITPVTMNTVRVFRVGAAAQAFDPRVYLSHFAPGEWAAREAVARSVALAAVDADSLRAEVERESMTEYRLFRSPDLEQWTEIARRFPEVGADLSNFEEPIELQGDGGSFYRAEALRGRIHDMSEEVQEVRFTTGGQNSTFLDVIKILPNLAGTYSFNGSAEQTVSVDWLEISETRTQILLRSSRRIINGRPQPAIVFFLDRSTGDTGSGLLRLESGTANDTADDDVLIGTFEIIRK